MTEQEHILYLNFKKKHEAELEKLNKLAKEHKIIFVARIWPQNERFLYASFNLESCFHTAYKVGIGNAYPEHTRISYIELDKQCPRDNEIGFIGLPRRNPSRQWNF